MLGERKESNWGSHTELISRLGKSVCESQIMVIYSKDKLIKKILS